jgi:hypothetical protein
MQISPDLLESLLGGGRSGGKKWHHKSRLKMD